MNNAALVYSEAFWHGLHPDPELTVSVWADQYRYLSQKASAEPGRWRTDRTPYLREILDTLSPMNPIQRVVFMAGAQVGKTEAGNNWTGYIIHHAPGAMMMVQPTVDTAKRLSKQRLAPMIDETPVLKELVAPSRSRDGGNTQMVKEFPGGVLILTGANSAVGLRSMPVRYLFLDEVDAYPVDVDGEGDPIQLAEKRTTTFARRKIYMSSTPTVKDISRIEREYLNSDQRRYYLPCPHCDHKQHLRWSQIKWQDDDPSTAQYACEECGCLIDERHKTDMLRAGEWIATSQGDGKTAGFHLNALYSPLGWKAWADIVEEFMRAKGDPSLLKTWVNTVLGETWEEDAGAKIGADLLQSRVEFYQPGVVPARALILTAGVDCQDNRLAVVLRAWGRDEESWLVDHMEIYGDPAQPQVWKQLDEVLMREYPHEIAKPVKIAATCIDSGGHYTHEVYAYARDRRQFNILPIKGSSQRAKPAIGRPSRVDINYKGRVIKGGVEIYMVGTDTIKSTIFSRLKLGEHGAGSYHFHGEASDAYFEQLVAEKQITRYVKGFPVREWVKKNGARNEALDCEVYSFAALNWLYMKFNRRTIWEQFEKALEINPVISGDKPAQSTPKPQSNTIRRRSNSFVMGFK